MRKGKNEANNFLNNYFENNQEVGDFTAEFKNFLENSDLLLKSDEIKENLCILIPVIFSSFFNLEKDLGGKLDKEYLVDKFFQNIKEYHKKFEYKSIDIKILLNELMRLNFSLDYIKEIYQLFICGFNIILSYQKIKDKFDENIIKQIKKIIGQNILSENNIYIIFEKQNKIGTPKYNISFFTKKKNKNSIFFFEKMESKNIYKNLFNDDEISKEQFNKILSDDINEEEIKEVKDDTLLIKLTEERNKNKKLEKELLEKNKKIEILENEIKQLKDELNKQITINKDNENIIALPKMDETIKALLEKDKEIKELKEKMKRFPFELNENEKLISVIFTNSKKEFYYSIICKNTDRFSTIEIKLYDKFPKYGETANYFFVNEKRIINHKTLEDNHIKDSSIIILK